MVVSLVISEVLHAVDRILEGVRFEKIKKKQEKTKRAFERFQIAPHNPPIHCCRIQFRGRYGIKLSKNRNPYLCVMFKTLCSLDWIFLLNLKTVLCLNFLSYVLTNYFAFHSYVVGATLDIFRALIISISYYVTGVFIQCEGWQKGCLYQRSE